MCVRCVGGDGVLGRKRLCKGAPMLRRRANASKSSSRCPLRCARHAPLFCSGLDGGVICDRPAGPRFLDETGSCPANLAGALCAVLAPAPPLPSPATPRASAPSLLLACGSAAASAAGAALLRAIGPPCSRGVARNELRSSYLGDGGSYACAVWLCGLTRWWGGHSQYRAGFGCGSGRRDWKFNRNGGASEKHTPALRTPAPSAAAAAAACCRPACQQRCWAAG